MLATPTTEEETGERDGWARSGTERGSTVEWPIGDGGWRFTKQTSSAMVSTGGGGEGRELGGMVAETPRCWWRCREDHGMALLWPSVRTERYALIMALEEARAGLAQEKAGKEVDQKER